MGVGFGNESVDRRGPFRGGATHGSQDFFRGRRTAATGGTPMDLLDAGPTPETRGNQKDQPHHGQEHRCRERERGQVGRSIDKGDDPLHGSLENTEADFQDAIDRNDFPAEKAFQHSDRYGRGKDTEEEAHQGPPYQEDQGRGEQPRHRSPRHRIDK